MCRVLSHKFGVVQAQRTSLKTHEIRESEVCRALSHKVGVVQAHPRTPSQRMLLERARCVELCHRDPFPLKTPASRESKVCRHEFGVVQAQRTPSNPLKTHDFKASEALSYSGSSTWNLLEPS